MRGTQFTPGPWHAGHLGDESTTCNCKSVVSEVYAGGICEMDVSNGIKLISEGGNDAPPQIEPVANMHLIAAAPDMYAVLHSFLRTACQDCYGFAELQEQAASVLARARGEPVPPTNTNGQ
jgi:hypothetical protein